MAPKAQVQPEELTREEVNELKTILVKMRSDLYAKEQELKQIKKSI